MSETLNKIEICYLISNFLNYDERKNIFKQNKEFYNLYKEIYNKLDKEFEIYYNLNTRKKLNDISDIIKTTINYFEPNYFKKNELKNKIIFEMVYSKLINKILRLNRILFFRYTIDRESNINQLVNIIENMDYNKEVILTVKEIEKINLYYFSLILKFVDNHNNIANLRIYFGENYFAYVRNAKKFELFIKEKVDENFIKFLTVFYEFYNSKIDFHWFNFENFNEIFNEFKYDFKSEKIELSLTFEDNKLTEYKECINFLSNKIKCEKLKFFLFTIPDFQYINELFSKISPSNIWLIPYKDVDIKYSDDFLNILSRNKNGITNLNIINIVGFKKEVIRNFLENEKDLVELRITGELSEECMEEILNCYIDNYSNNFKIKKISLNGPIKMNEKWKNLICKFLTLDNIELFHIDCFFNGREYMKDIAEAFYNNKTLKSFALRNSVRGIRDEFVDVLKELLYSKNIDRKEVFIKIRLYKLL